MAYDFISAWISSLNYPLFTAVATFLDTYTYPILFIGWLIVFLTDRKKRRREAAALLIAAALLYFAVDGLKTTFAVPRPCTDDISKIPCPQEYSFPSGHAAFAALFVPAFTNSLLFMFYLPFYIVVAISRIYLGVHTLADVVAGTVIAFALYLATEKIVRWIE